ncbi:MAG: hypothetical protein ABR573_00700 [Candidatus Dormibacteria bacterium]
MRTRVVLAVMALASVAGCGGNAARPANNHSQSGASTVGSSPSPSSAPRGTTSSVNKSYWHSGFKVTVSDATVVHPPKPSPGYSIAKSTLLLNATFENLGPDNAAPYNMDLVLQSGTNSYLDHDSQDEKLPEVPGLQRTNGVIAFFIDDKFSLSSAVLLVGNARNNQAQLPLGKTGKTITLEPQKVAISGTINAGAFSAAVSGGTLAYDDPKRHQEEKAGDAALTVNFAVTGTSDRYAALSTENLVLKLPDGTAVAATRNSTYAVPGKGLTTPDETAEWTFKATDGAYDMIIKGKYGANDADQQADLPFNITVGLSATAPGSPPVGGAYPSPADSETPQPSPSGH